MRCPYCHDGITRGVVCPTCKAGAHRECIRENRGRCASCGFESKKREPLPFDFIASNGEAIKVAMVMTLPMIYILVIGLLTQANAG